MSELNNNKLFYDIDLSNIKVKIYDVKKNTIINYLLDKYLVYINSGSIDIFINSIDGTTIYVNSLSKNDVLGINNLYELKENYTISKTKSNVKLICIKKEDVVKLIENNPIINQRLLSMLGDKTRFLLNRIENLSIKSSKIKLANYLLYDSNIEIFKNKEKFSKYLGISRATLFRELHYLKALNIIQYDRYKFEIIDYSRLKELL